MKKHWIRIMPRSHRSRLRHGPTPLLCHHAAFLRRIVAQPQRLYKAGASQLRAIQEVLQNVKMENIRIPPKVIKGTPRHQIGKGLASVCCYRTRPRRIKALLPGNSQTGGFPLATLVQVAIPIGLKHFTKG